MCLIVVLTRVNNLFIRIQAWFLDYIFFFPMKSKVNLEIDLIQNSKSI